VRDLFIQSSAISTFTVLTSLYGLELDLLPVSLDRHLVKLPKRQHNREAIEEVQEAGI